MGVAAWFDADGRTRGPLSRIPAAAKLGVALAVVVATVLLPRRAFAAYAADAAALVALTALGRVPARFLLRRLLATEPLAIGVALLSLVQPGGGSIFLGMVVKSTLCLWTMILLIGTTPFTDLLQVFRRLRLPGILVTTFALTYRYLFVLADESERMRRARRSRSFVAGRRRRWLALTTVAGALFVRASERSERIYAAMCARGWRT